MLLISLEFLTDFYVWKSNIAINSCVQLIVVDFLSQFFTSHAIFNPHAYVEWVNRIISCEYLSFSICDVASWSTFPMPQALRPNTCNNCFEINLTKVGFGNGGHRYATIINSSHSHWGFSMTATSNLLIIPPLHGHGISQDVTVHFSMVLMW